MLSKLLMVAAACRDFESVGFFSRRLRDLLEAEREKRGRAKALGSALRRSEPEEINNERDVAGGTTNSSRTMARPGNEKQLPARLRPDDPLRRHPKPVAGDPEGGATTIGQAGWRTTDALARVRVERKAAACRRHRRRAKAKAAASKESATKKKPAPKAKKTRA
jgi:hypothetical protein